MNPEADDTLRYASDSAGIGTFDWDVVNARVACSEPFGRLWGLADEDLDASYSTFARRIHPADATVLDASGKAVGFHGEAMQNDARTRTVHGIEREARDAESRDRTLFDHAQVGIVVANQQGFYTDVNPAIGKMLGDTREEMLTLHGSDVAAPSEQQHVDLAFEEAATRAGTTDTGSSLARTGPLFR